MILDDLRYGQGRFDGKTDITEEVDVGIRASDWGKVDTEKRRDEVCEE